MKSKTVYLTKASATGALYAVLTLIGAVFGLSYGGIQFRFSEALCVLPLFTASAVPGIAIGCFVANIFSSVTPLDMIIGTVASLVAGVLTRKCRNITVKGFPLLSLMFPVCINAVFVGFELALVSGEKSFFTVFAVEALSVGVGEAAVIFTLGSVLVLLINKNDRLRKLISDR